MLEGIRANKYVEYMDEINYIKTRQINDGLPFGTATIEEVTSSYDELAIKINEDGELPEEQKKQLIDAIDKAKGSLIAREKEYESAIEETANVPEKEYKELLKEADDYFKMSSERDINWEALIIELFGGVEERVFIDEPSKHNVRRSYYVFFTKDELKGILEENKDVLKAAYERIKKDYPNIAPDLADIIGDLTSERERE